MKTINARPFPLPTFRQTLRLRRGLYVLFDSTKRPLLYKQRLWLHANRKRLTWAALLTIAFYGIALPLHLANTFADRAPEATSRRF